MSELSHIEKRFLYYTECACATVESMPKSWSKSQRQRLINIRDGMLGTAMGIVGTSVTLLQEVRDLKNIRTAERIQELRDLTHQAKAKHQSEE